MILGIDTSGSRCAVAVLDGGRVLRHLRDMERGHAEALFPMIEAALGEAGAGYAALSRIGVCTGPGSFTGIRVGVAAARGLALGLGIPAIGIGRLEALATEAAPGRHAIALVAGPQGVVYAQDIDANGRPEASPRLVNPEFRAPADRVVIGHGGLLPKALPDPAVIARLAAAREPGPPPAPLYLRGAGAAPPREAPPTLLDP